MKFFKAKAWISQALSSPKQAWDRIRGNRFTEKLVHKSHNAVSAWRNYRIPLLKALGIVCVALSITAAGNQYVTSHTGEIYRVYINNELLGAVDDLQVVEQFIIEKYEQLLQSSPNMHMVLNSDEVTFESEKAFMSYADNEAVLQQLDEKLVATAIGVQLVIDGETMGYVKDKETAQQILDQIKSKYLPVAKSSKTVSILSSEGATEPEPGQSVLVSDGFEEQVDLRVGKIDPEQLVDPGELLRKLETGGVKPIKYEVQQGDCISCIATKFDISRDVIYENNPGIDDFLSIGQEIDLTVLQPMLTVRTVEKQVENEEIQFDIEYRDDDQLRLGMIEPISQGRNGLKKMTYLVTKANGLQVGEELMDEQVLEPAVNGVARRGTKVIPGEGSGEFAWPVIGAQTTSGYGTRWESLHKGIDLVSDNLNILASDHGEVVYAGNRNDGYGNMILIDHKNGYSTLYAHLSKIYVSRGDIVEKGENIGYMGNTGLSFGVHLHFEVLRWGSPENPMKYLSR